MGEIQSKQIPWEEIPKGTLIPDGMFEFEIIELGEDVTGGQGKLPAGCLMYVLTSSVVEPADYAGWNSWERFVVGTADDPNADDPKTWKGMAARNLRMVLEAAQVALDGDMQEVAGAAIGARFMGLMSHRTTEQGSEMNSIRSYFKVGEKAPGLAEAAAPAAPARPTRAPAPASRPAPARTPAPAPAPTPARRPAPAAAPPAQRPAAPQPRPTAPKAKTLLCSICNQQVAKDEYADHVEQCEGPQE